VKKGSLFLAKITRPKAEGTLPRERLFSYFDRLKDQGIVWISGPAGSGKTTLVTNYVDARKIPCLWYQLDEGDTDIASFFYYMGLAAKKASPRNRKPLPLLTPEYLMGITTFTRRFFENLYERLKTPALLVFDNYHCVASDSPLHEVIFNGFSIIPPGKKVIIISRSDPPVLFSQLHAQGRMTFLRWEELRFTLPESRHMIASRIPRTGMNKLIKQLYQITQGWAAGLVLISGAIRRGVKLQSLEKKIPEEIVNYFGSVIFAKTREETQTFLMKTAFIPRMTVKVSEELTGSSEAETIFSGLVKNNFFIEQHYSVEPVYQYHPLFRNFLLSRAKESFSQEELLDLHHRSALLLEESGQMEEAAQIYMDQKNWEGLIRLIMKQASAFLNQGRYQLLDKWLTSLPDHLVEDNPWLLYWLGTCRFPLDLSSSQNYLKKAYEKFRKEGDMEGTFLSWSGIVDGIAFSHKDLYRLDHWIRTLEDLMNEIKEFPSQEFGARVASSMVSAMALRWPHHPGFYKWAERSLAFTEPPQMVNIRIWLLFNLFLREFVMGEFEKGALIRNQLSPLTKSREVPPFFKMLGKLTDSIYYQVTGAHEKCIEAVSEGMELSRTTGIHILDQPFLVHALLSGINVNDLETAREFFNRLGSTLNLNPSSSDLLDLRNRYIYHFSSARYALVSGNFGQFNHHMALAFKYGEEMGSPVFQGGDHLLNALALHRLGKRKEAMEELEKGSLIAQETQSKILLFNSLLSKAYFSFEKGDEASGLKFLKMALSIGKDQRLLNTHFDDPKVTAILCMKALEAGIEVDYVQEIIQRRGLIPDQDPFQLENWPWPLKIYSLGRFGILRNGKSIRFSRKAQERPLFMLKALLALGGRGVREEDLSDILWPEADGDAAHNSFEITLYRLRKLIDYPQALQLYDGRLTLNSRYCWVDAWAFERLLGEIDAKGWREDSFLMAEKAIKMYRGAFLAKEMEHPWLISMRERLRSKFLRSVSRLGNYWCQARQWGKAIECYYRGLEVDDLAEELCQGAMVCYQNLGLEANALSIYNRFEKRIKAVLGIEPSSKTKALRDALLKKSNKP
jgi:LuxR family maltose regulon positive regulatory protein